MDIINNIAGFLEQQAPYLKDVMPSIVIVTAIVVAVTLVTYIIYSIVKYIYKKRTQAKEQ